MALPTVVLNRPSAAVSGNGNTEELAVASLERLALDLNVTALSGTAPEITFYFERKGADGIWYSIAPPKYMNAIGSYSVGIGPACEVAVPLGFTNRLRWVIGGTGGPTVTFSASILGK